MQYIAILTLEEKDLLVGQLVCPDVYFNPIENQQGIFISQEEINNSIYPENDWIKTLPLIEYQEPE